MKEEQEDDEEWMLEGDGGGGMSNDALRVFFLLTFASVSNEITSI